MRRGHSFGAERYDAKLKEELVRIEGRIERQLHLLGWWFSRLREHLPPENIVRYEEMVSSGGKALEVVCPGAAAALNEPLRSKNANLAYDREAVRRLARRLLASEGAY